MKRTVTIFILITAMLFSLVSCDENGEGYIDAEVDYNFSGCSEEELYTTVIAIKNNYSSYKGKTVAISGKYSYIYDFKTATCVSDIIIATDPTNCCDDYLKIEFADGVSAVPGAFTTFIGTFTDRQSILVTETVNHTTVTSYDVDARSLSASEINSLITKYGAEHISSELNGKKILLFGHHTTKTVEQSGIRYKYLLGYDGDGKLTWQIELDKLADGVSLPIQNGSYLNPCIVTGTLSFYTEGSETYASIDVETITRVYLNQ